MHDPTTTLVDYEQVQFVHPFTMTLAGNRRTGKTHFTKTLLLRNRELIASSPLDSIIWFHGAPQQNVHDELTEALQSHGQRIEFVRDLPQVGGKTVQEFVAERPGQRKLIVFDDLMATASNRADVAALFTHGRHEDVSVVFLTQNLFHKSKYARDMSLNTDYMVLFKNPRDPSMITHFGQQMGNVKFLKQAYRDATTDPFSHLFIDLRSETPDTLRYRSRVLDEVQIVYQPRETI